jgi:archaemetzincin
MRYLPYYILLSIIVFSSCNTVSSGRNDHGILGSFVSEKTRRIAIQPIGTIPNIQIEKVKKAIDSIYKYQVVVLKSIQLPESCFTNVKVPRYRADKLLEYLISIKSDSIDNIVGLTNKDISTTKKDEKGNVKEPRSRYEDWGVFGLGYMPGSSTIISTFRITDEDRKLTQERLNKVVVHELGHNFGLPHCPETKCVMADAVESIKTVDKGELTLCKKCKDLLILK